MDEKTVTKTINISPSSSASGLRELLDSEAISRGMKVTPMVSAIYVYAVKHQSSFATPLQNPRKKDGEHIGAKVPEEVAEALQRWAKRTNRSRGYLCCYILEKIFESNLLDEIISNSTIPLDVE